MSLSDATAGRPLLLTAKAEMRAAVEAPRRQGLSIGLVPTMGYLHEGHLSLARLARRENDLVVMSVFVNPSQFGPQEDLDRYPRDLQRDLEMACSVGVDLVFHPEVGEMYGPGHSTWVDVEGLTENLCGASRPGHFRGVATVVTKLFTICRPHRAYFGQKDAQQAFIIRRVAVDLDLDVEVVIAPIVREEDGLAMSSRNVHLSTEERAQAPLLFAGLRSAEALVAGGERDASVVRAHVVNELARAPLARVDYVELVDTASLQPVDRVEGEVLLALAAFFGRTRLIDNVVLTMAECRGTGCG